MITDVVPMIAVRARAKERRTVDIADSEFLQVRDDFGRIFETEASIELQSIRRSRYAGCKWHILISPLTESIFERCASWLLGVLFAENDQLRFGQKDLFTVTINTRRRFSAIDPLIRRDHQLPIPTLVRPQEVIFKLQHLVVCQKLGHDQNVSPVSSSIANCDRSARDLLDLPTTSATVRQVGLSKPQE